MKMRMILIILELCAPASAQETSTDIPSLVITNQCSIGYIQASDDIYVDWACVEKNAAKATEHGGPEDQTEAMALLLKAVRDGTFKDTSK